MQERGDGRGRDARVRQPAMQREGGGLGQNAEENQRDAPGGNLGALHGGEFKGARLSPDAQEADEHDQRAEDRDYKRLIRADDGELIPIEPDEPPAADGADFPEEI
ncbi:hypothetical protein SDC9_110826 [bioreactor metagenome]|uniref:Uncharacterized protein n=1 Tax=bioreactor metagenome TaxID=1076179 RepID=A0A645BHB2_9ZZZZ